MADANIRVMGFFWSAITPGFKEGASFLGKVILDVFIDKNGK
jgi:hypothetical protein